MATINCLSKYLFNYFRTKRYYGFLLFSFLFIGISCNVSNHLQPEWQRTKETVAVREEQTGQNKTEVKIIGDKLCTLYLENTGTNPQLYRLIRNNKRARVTFQFFVDKDKQLNLYAFHGQRIKGAFRAHRGEFFKNDTLRLTRSDKSDTTIGTNEVVLGDLQLDKEAIVALKKFVVKPNGQNNDSAKYIWLVPEIKTEPLDGLYHIVYNFRRSSFPPGAVTEKQDDASIEGASANPSPPRKTY